jgi:undecaprenyl-diphosphatase
MEGSLKSELLALDDAVYDAVAGTPTPQMDRFLQPLTGAADYSRLWIASAAVLAVVGGARGRRAALHGMASVGLASGVVNQIFKHASRRARPDRAGSAVPEARHVPMPTSTSFPSGHSASAFAFAEGVSHSMPVVGLTLRLAATTVAYTRVHAGVHYPGDVLAGATIGVACGKAAPRLLGAVGSRIPQVTGLPTA